MNNEEIEQAVQLIGDLWLKTAKPNDAKMRGAIELRDLVINLLQNINDIAAAARDFSAND
jgi:hypothetical protein